MFTVTVGNITVHFGPLIVLGILIVAILCFHAVHGVTLGLKIKRISKDIAMGNYDSIIMYSVPLLRTYTKYKARLSTSAITSRIEFLHIALAISYFSRSQSELFLEHINALQQYDDIRHFWLAVFYLQQNDLGNAQLHYAKINKNDETLISRTYFESLMQYKQGEYDLAKNKMHSIYVNLKHPVLKQIADEILL